MSAIEFAKIADVPSGDYIWKCVVRPVPTRVAPFSCHLLASCPFYYLLVLVVLNVTNDEEREEIK
jgi:hypothetical protein